MNNLRVMIVEDHPLMKMSIKKVLERCNGIEVIGEASTGKQAVELSDGIMPDVIIMDIRLPDMDGITTMRRIRDRHKEVKVLMFSGFDDKRYVIKAFESGADGYVLKSIEAGELVEAVRQVASGLNPISPQLTRNIIPIGLRCVRGSDRLTPREREVWKLLSNGASNAEISQKLFVSESTVKFHIRNIFHKLGVKNRVEAAKLAYDTIAA